VWVTSEFARAHLPEISFPWNLLGYSAAANAALAQTTTLTGIYGLSFLVAAFNALLAWRCGKRSQPKETTGYHRGIAGDNFGVTLAGGRFVPEAKTAISLARCSRIFPNGFVSAQLVRTSQRGHGRAGSTEP